jgi:hypothetical protein
MDKEDFGPRRRIGFMTGAMKVPTDFDSMGREEIEAAFTASDPRLMPAVRSEKPAQPEKPGNWDGFKQALAVTEVPSDFLTPEDRQQGVHIRDADAEILSTVKLGTLLAQIGREAELTDAECAMFDRAHADNYEPTVQSVQLDLNDAGMNWWNGLTEADRRYWCLAAMTEEPTDAWKYFRLVTAPSKTVTVSGDD